MENQDFSRKNTEGLLKDQSPDHWSNATLDKTISRDIYVYRNGHPAAKKGDI